MNKFVKGAKNLAFALSFVTVAACGNVKKAELEAELQKLEKKIKNTLDGGAKDGTNNKDQGYARNEDVDATAKGLEGKIGDLRKGMISKEDVINANVNNSGVGVETLKNLGIDLRGEKFMVSVVGGKVVVKRGDVVVFEEFNAAGVNPVQFIADVISLKGEFVFDASFKDENRIKFIDGGSANIIKVGGYTSANVNDSIALIILLGEIGGGMFEKFFDRNKEVLGSANFKVAGQLFSGVKAVLDTDEEKKKKFGAGLEILFGVKGDYKTGGSSEPSGLGYNKWGFVLSENVGDVQCVPLESNS